MDRYIVRKKGKITLAIGLALSAVILAMVLISITAYPLNIQIGRSFDKIALDENDLPPGSYQVNAVYRNASDVSSENKVLGWTEGYQIMFLREGQIILQQEISIYPRENIEKVIDMPLELADWQVEEQFSPNIGQKSKMHFLTQKNGDAVRRAYAVEFIKGDTYSALYGIDENLVIELSKKAENKIPDIYVTPFILLALALVAMYLLGMMTYHVSINVANKRRRKS